MKTHSANRLESLHASEGLSVELWPHEHLRYK